MSRNEIIAFIGPGVMAEAMAAGLIDRAGWPPERILMSGPRAERLSDLSARLRVRTEVDNRQAASQASVVVLSVKPQTLPEVTAGLSGGIPPEALVVSIVAGARLADRRGRIGEVEDSPRAGGSYLSRIAWASNIGGSPPALTKRKRTLDSRGWYSKYMGESAFP